MIDSSKLLWCKGVMGVMVRACEMPCFYAFHFHIVPVPVIIIYFFVVKVSLFTVKKNLDLHRKHLLGIAYKCQL